MKSFESFAASGRELTREEKIEAAWENVPPLFGYKKLANFEVYSYPQFGSYALAAAALTLVLALYLAWRQSRREPA